MLKEYRAKRNFQVTSEPKGLRGRSNENPIFVIQEHHASHLHYDLRLEMQGILKSWAVPKGVPTTFNEKHLAVLTEDHPLEYANFEGEIPKGEYGGGLVKLWDKGRYENLTVDKEHKKVGIEQAVKMGHLLFQLKGKRLKNECFLLHRFKKEKKEHWFLMRIRPS